MQESGQKEVNFPSSFILLMLRTCGVDAPHHWCESLAPMVRSTKYNAMDSLLRYALPWSEGFGIGLNAILV
ncbi:hypothetical protein [Prevotella melaninogenica]|jgi:hypothetical protein|uniref:hypothetical protein n=1 Tax=Prevotella melaninogenica TaxID=28132 RepID=UPI002432DDFA|nr:hypothetical protein [Prevotella melaninogenica]